MIPESLSIVERQILANQFRILSKMESDPQDYETKIEILENGYTEQYYEVFDVNTDEIPLEICEETSQILNMYRRINNCIKKLSEKERTELNLEKIAFEGFDVKRDFHFQYMTFMIEKMNLWREYRNLYLDSRSRLSLMKYRKMLEYQNYLLDNDQYDLTKSNLKKLIAILEKETLPLVK
ncbi:YfbU family protein [Flavobacterium enshiense]|uniref:YfbU family protein n=1 Tax=Flavobacterium enshiense TaxID=1341165 RepID=UPI00345CB144